jgi:hypothetical protein
MNVGMVETLEIQIRNCHAIFSNNQLEMQTASGCQLMFFEHAVTFIQSKKLVKTCGNNESDQTRTSKGRVFHEYTRCSIMPHAPSTFRRLHDNIWKELNEWQQNPRIAHLERMLRLFV